MKERSLNMKYKVGDMVKIDWAGEHNNVWKIHSVDETRGEPRYAVSDERGKQTIAWFEESELSPATAPNDATEEDCKSENDRQPKFKIGSYVKVCGKGDVYTIVNISSDPVGSLIPTYLLKNCKSNTDELKYIWETFLVAVKCDTCKYDGELVESDPHVCRGCIGTSYSNWQPKSAHDTDAIVKGRERDEQHAYSQGYQEGAKISEEARKAFYQQGYDEAKAEFYENRFIAGMNEAWRCAGRMMQLIAGDRVRYFGEDWRHDIFTHHTAMEAREKLQKFDADAIPDISAKIKCEFDDLIKYYGVDAVKAALKEANLPSWI